MANSALLDKKYPIPMFIVNKVNGKLFGMAEGTGEGIKRAKFITKNGFCTYQMMKRLKNFFDHFNPETDSKEQYDLAGGEDMKRWVENTLRQDRASTALSKKNRQDINVNVNQNKHTMGAQSGSVNLRVESVIKEDVMSDVIVNQNALAVIYDKEGRVLLVKRSPETEQWMPDKWALVGGSVEMGEEPIEAVQRETMEETELQLDNFNEVFAVDKSPNSKLIVFTAYYDGDPFAVQLNAEHTAYGWYTIPEMEYIDGVPNLVLFVSTALSKVNQ